MGAPKVGTAIIPHFGLDSPHLRQFIFGRRPGRTLCRVALWSFLIVICFHHLLIPIQIIGSSMSPTYRNGALNLVNRRSYAKKTPIRGDVIALNADGELLLKRIIALPGETVAITNGRIYIDNRPLADSFSREEIPWEMEAGRLGSDEFFVIGDNRSASIFCRVCKKDILGKTVF